MKKTLLKILGNKIVLTSMVACSVFMVAITSCTKSSNSSGTNYATQFVGTWTVTSNSCGSATGSVIYGAGSGSNTITNAGSVGSGSCLKNVTLTGTATANGFVFLPQTYTDGCGNSYTIGVVATLSGGVLTETETISGSISATCTATLTK